MNNKRAKTNATETLPLPEMLSEDNVDEGNDVTSAEDIFKALLASLINNSKVSEVQFDTSLFKMNGDSIQKISFHH